MAGTEQVTLLIQATGVACIVEMSSFFLHVYFVTEYEVKILALSVQYIFLEYTHICSAACLSRQVWKIVN